MKKIFAVVAAVVLASFIGCAAEEEPEVESTTVVESVTIEPVATDPAIDTGTMDTAATDTVAPAETTATEPASQTGTDTAEAEGKLPKTHTVDMEGVMHAPGLENPTAKCAACHGKDLQGGRSKVSCHDCHDQNWS